MLKLWSHIHREFCVFPAGFGRRVDNSHHSFFLGEGSVISSFHSKINGAFGLSLPISILGIDVIFGWACNLVTRNSLQAPDLSGGHSPIQNFRPFNAHSCGVQ